MDEAVVKSVLPHSTEAEQSVIAAMLMDAEAITAAAEVISGEDFYNKQYGLLFDTIVELQGNTGGSVDLVVLQNRLKEKDAPPEVSSLEYVRDIMDMVFTSAKVKDHAEIVRQKAVLRKLIRTTEHIADTCYAGKEDVESILEETEKKVFDIVQRRNTGDFVPIKTVVMNALNMIEKAAKNKGAITGVPTLIASAMGIPKLEYRVG